MSHVKINIPEPCNEQWHLMTPKEKGRYCKACSKTIVDFSNLTDKEILNAISNGTTCGKFHKSQLNRELDGRPNKSFGKLKWLAMLFSPLAAQANNSPVPLFNSTFNESFTKAESQNSNTSKQITIKGKVVDAYSGEEIIAANIFVIEHSIGVITDVYGDFYLSFETTADTIWLSVSYVGYAGRVVQIPIESIDESITIELEQKDNFIDEVCVEVERNNTFREDIMGVLIATKVEPVSIFRFRKHFRRLKSSIQIRRAYQKSKSN
jgi:hypothetical protein